MRGLWWMVLAGCGRIAFDPSGDGGDPGGADGAVGDTSGDGATGFCAARAAMHTRCADFDGRATIGEEFDATNITGTGSGVRNARRSGSRRGSGVR